MMISYPKKYIDDQGFVKPIDGTDNTIIREIKALDERVEELSKKIDTGGNSQYDPEVINELTTRVGVLEDETTQLFETIGADEGEKDTNLDDIMSKLASHSSSIAALRLEDSSLNGRINVLRREFENLISTIEEMDLRVNNNSLSIGKIEEAIELIKSDIAHINTRIVVLEQESTAVDARLTALEAKHAE